MNCGIPSCEPSNQNPTAITIVYLEYSLRALYDSILELLSVGSYHLSSMLGLGNSQGTDEVYKGIASE